MAFFLAGDRKHARRNSLLAARSGGGFNTIMLSHQFMQILHGLHDLVLGFLPAKNAAVFGERALHKSVTLGFKRMRPGRPAECGPEVAFN
jgi:hypothetical protein